MRKNQKRRRLRALDKLDAQHNQALAAVQRHTHRFEHRLDHLETNLARLDEPTCTGLPLG